MQSRISEWHQRAVWARTYPSSRPSSLSFHSHSVLADTTNSCEAISLPHNQPVSQTATNGMSSSVLFVSNKTQDDSPAVTVCLSNAIAEAAAVAKVRDKCCYTSIRLPTIVSDPSEHHHPGSRVSPDGTRDCLIRILSLRSSCSVIHQACRKLLILRW